MNSNVRRQCCSICKKTGHNKRTCPAPKFWNDICHSARTEKKGLLDAYTHSVEHPDIWKTDSNSQFPVVIHNDSDCYFDIYWLIDSNPNDSKSDQRLYTSGPINWKLKHWNVKPGMRIIIPIGCVGHVFGFFKKCRDKSDIILNHVIRIRECNKGKTITFDGDKIYVEHNGWKVTNLPLLSLLTDLDDYVDLKYISNF